MDPLVIVLRFVHVVFGALWVGMVAFVTFFLMPALQAAGPEGGKVMAAVEPARLHDRDADPRRRGPDLRVLALLHRGRGRSGGSSAGPRGA